MECPACTRTLTSKTVADLNVDVCEGGCGGVWFDNFELRKVDEEHESAGKELLDLERDPSVEVDHEERWRCPKCGDPVMHRYFFTVKREVEVDECPECAGVWLDAGELGRIRQQFEDAKARDEAASGHYEELFGAELDRMREESRDDLERSRAFANAFRFVLPSYWLKGDQKWGAY